MREQSRTAMRFTSDIIAKTPATERPRQNAT